MEIKKILALGIILSLIVIPLYAQPKKGGPAAKPTAGERISRETADAIADVLTGEESSGKTSSKGVPPGLAKKDKTPQGLAEKGKTPAGWSKGEKTGWDKETEPKKDSPIRAFIKKLFGKES